MNWKLYVLHYLKKKKALVLIMPPHFSPLNKKLYFKVPLKKPSTSLNHLAERIKHTFLTTSDVKVKKKWREKKKKAFSVLPRCSFHLRLNPQHIWTLVVALRNTFAYVFPSVSLLWLLSSGGHGADTLFNLRVRRWSRLTGCRSIMLLGSSLRVSNRSSCASRYGMLHICMSGKKSLIRWRNLSRLLWWDNPRRGVISSCYLAEFLQLRVRCYDPVNDVDPWEVLTCEKYSTISVLIIVNFEAPVSSYWHILWHI